MRKEIGIAKCPSDNKSSNHRIYGLDESCFDTLNEKSAYRIWFLYWDWSCTTENKIRLTLWRQDKDHLKKFKDFIKSSDRPIKTKMVEWKPYAHIEFRSWRVHNKVKEYELTTRKELRHRLNLWLLQPEIRRHFLRWLFDADWCFYIENPNRFRCEVTGYMPIMKDVKNLLVLDWVISDQKKIVKNGSIWRLKFWTNESISIYNYLYGKSPFYYLTRKYDLWRNYLQRLSDKTSKKDDSIV